MISKKIEDSNSSVNIDLTDTHRHSTTTESAFLPSAHKTFFRIDCMLCHKTSLNKFKRIEIMASMFSDYNRMKLEVKNRKKFGKFTRGT